jgi:hypothetical protein
LVRLAIGTRGWYAEVAATHSRGIANAALPCAGQAKAVFLGSVVVVVVVDVGTVVVVVPDVVVVTGTVVVVVVVVVVDVVDVVDVVVERTVVVVVVVVVVTGTHPLGTGNVVVVVVVDANAGPSWADVVVDDVRTTTKESATVKSEQRRSQGIKRRVTQRMYNAPARTPDLLISITVSLEFRIIPTGLGWHFIS